jgi:hypothetical protein
VLSKPNQNQRLNSIGTGQLWVLGICLLMVSTPAWAQLWGTRAYSQIGDYRNGAVANTTLSVSGGAGVPATLGGIDDAVQTDRNGNGPWDRGTTRGFAGLAFNANTPPTLRAEAYLTGNLSRDFYQGSFPDGAFAKTTVLASDLFQYTGSQPATLSLTVQLEGDVYEPFDPFGNAWADSYLRGRVALLADTPEYRFTEDIYGMLFEFPPASPLMHAGVPAFDLNTLYMTDDTGGSTQSVQTTLTFDVMPGQRFYIWQTVEASVGYGDRYADGYNSMSSYFDQPQLVRSLSAPEPATLLLVLLGLGWAALFRRH